MEYRMFYKRKKELYDKTDSKFVLGYQDNVFNILIDDIEKLFIFDLDFSYISLLKSSRDELIYDDLILYFTYGHSDRGSNYTFIFKTEEDMTLFKLKYGL